MPQSQIYSVIYNLLFPSDCMLCSPVMLPRSLCFFSYECSYEKLLFCFLLFVFYMSVLCGLVEDTEITVLDNKKQRSGLSHCGPAQVALKGHSILCETGGVWFRLEETRSVCRFRTKNHTHTHT